MKTSAILIALLTAFAASNAEAAVVTFNFSGVSTNGWSQSGWGLPVGTPFSGTFSYDTSAVGTTSSYYGGTQNLFSNAYTKLTLTIGGQTVTETAPGTMALYDNVTPPNSIPVGDSLYTFDPLNGKGPSPSTGSFNGTTPGFIYLGFVDSTGKAFSGPNLPSSLSLNSFNPNGAFVGVNYGPTTGISFISSLSPVPEPSEFALMASGLGLAGLIAYRRKNG